MDLVSFKWRLPSNSPVTKPLQQWECHMQRGPTAAGIDGSSSLNTTGKARIVAIAFIFSFVFLLQLFGLCYVLGSRFSFRLFRLWRLGHDKALYPNR